MTRDWQLVSEIFLDPSAIRRDLTGGHYAIVQQEQRLDGRWAWAIIRKELPTCDELWVAEGVSATQEQAKIAVGTWELNFHRHTVVLYLTENGWWTYRCRVCRADGLFVSGSLPVIYRTATADPDHEECDHAWQEEMVGVR